MPRPRDLSGLRDSLALLARACGRWFRVASVLLNKLAGGTATPQRLPRRCSRRAIAPEPSAMVRDGGVIADGYSAELDELRGLQTNAGEFLIALEKRANASAPASPTSRSSTTACTASTSRSPTPRREKVPDDYRRRQTLKNAERYITPELKTFEDKALSAQDRALALEKSLYESAARCTASPHMPNLQRIAARARAAGRRCAALPATAARSELLPPGVHERDRCSRSRRPPPGGRSAGRPLHRQRLPALAGAPAAARSPARTWAASPPTCARWR